MLHRVLMQATFPAAMASSGTHFPAPVACAGPAAARGHATQLWGSLVKQQVRAVRHGVSLHYESHPLGGATSKSKEYEGYR
jgi:hypothetical protein